VVAIFGKILPLGGLLPGGVLLLVLLKLVLI
jgi:hypothetical protein